MQICSSQNSVLTSGIFIRTTSRGSSQCDSHSDLDVPRGMLVCHAVSFNAVPPQNMKPHPMQQHCRYVREAKFSRDSEDQGKAIDLRVEHQSIVSALPPLRYSVVVDERGDSQTGTRHCRMTIAFSACGHVSFMLRTASTCHGRYVTDPKQFNLSTKLQNCAVHVLSSNFSSSRSKLAQ